MTNAKAVFSIAAPRDWKATNRPRATLLRPADKSVAVTVVADHSLTGQETEPGQYAKEALGQLPGFEGSASATARRVRGSPYESAVVEGRGKLSSSRSLQQITVAAFHRPNAVTYAVVVFRGPGASARTVERMLPTLRGGF